MFQPILSFLTSLKANNNRDWFEAHRSQFENAKSIFTTVVDGLIAAIGKSDPDILPLQVKDCIFRQYRDVRFSHDKTPYKNHMGAYLNKGGKKINTAGYYLHIEPGASLLAGGLYHPEPPHLQRVRQEIDYNLPEWKKIIGNKKLVESFPLGISREDSLQRPPKGYEPDNPALSFLKLKSFVFIQPLPDEDLGKMVDINSLVKHFTRLTPVIKFLNRSED